MIEYIILGALQGIVEWLPFSSEAVLVLAQLHWLGETDLNTLIKTALFFHLGTFLAALVYFWKDILILIKSMFHWADCDEVKKQEIKFYVISTIISAVVGYGLLQVIESVRFDFEFAGQIITIVVGLLLLVTAILQLLHSFTKERYNQDLNISDSVLAGLGQGLAALPGVSRSGTTVSMLLLRGLSKKRALQLSFIMSLPIVLGGNVLLNVGEGNFGGPQLVGLLSAFVVGLVTIHGLMKMAQKIKFGWFVFIFGILTLLAGIFVM